MLLLGCSSSHQDTKTSQPQPSDPPAVDTVAVLTKQLSATVSLPAQLIPYQRVDVYPKVTGFLESIRVDRGSRVHKGELLMRFYAPELASQRSQAEAAVGAAESQLVTARAKLASDKGTYLHMVAAAKTPGVVAENDVMVASQTANADSGTVAAAEQNVGAAREALRSVGQVESYLNIYAPFDGVVTARNLHPGALVGPASGQSGAMPIVQIVDTDRLRLVVPVPEAQVGEMKEGRQVAFTVPAYPGQTFKAPIRRISRDVNLNTRTMPVELDVSNTDGRLSSGSFATVQWPLERKYPTMFVPASAVTNDQQHTFVVRIRDGQAEWVNVQTGELDEKLLEIFGDLHAGDEVALRGTDELRPGSRVDTKPASLDYKASAK
jgi:RND family efflux transporter MFP subunit